MVVDSLLVTAGRLADDRGAKRVFQAGLVTFAVGSALCGLAPSVPVLVAARVEQACGAALLIPASLALLLPELPPARRAAAIGAWGAVGTLAAAAGPTLGALLVGGTGMAMGVLRQPAVLRPGVGSRPRGAAGVARPENGWAARCRRGAAHRRGVRAAVPRSGARPAVGMGLGGPSPPSPAQASLFPVLVVQTRRHPNPVLPAPLFRVRGFTVAVAGTLLFGAAFFANILCNVLFLTGVWHYSMLRTAAAILPSPLLAAACAPVAGRLADRYGYRLVIVPGAVLFALGQLWFGTRTGLRPAYLRDFLPGSLALGVAIGAAFPTLGSAAAHALPPEQFGVGSAVSATARQLGAVLGVAVLVAVLREPPRTGAGNVPLLLDRHRRRGQRLRRAVPAPATHRSSDDAASRRREAVICTRQNGGRNPAAALAGREPGGRRSRWRPVDDPSPTRWALRLFRPGCR